MPSLEPKYNLFDSVDHMLAPEALSELLSKPVTRVEVQPMNGHSGLAGGQLSYVDTDAGRLVLKRMSIASDWIMFVTEDTQCRSLRLWQYGLLDRLLPDIEHRIIASAYDGENWVILMNDLSGSFYTWENFPPQFVPISLDCLARIHNTFWNDSRLHDARLGLERPATFLNYYFKSHNYTGDALGILPQWNRNGWGAMKDLLDADVFQQMVALHENPEPLLNALRRYPYTLLHGDFRAENLAFTGNPTVIDWQGATRSLMTIDLAWITKHGYVKNVMSEEDAIAYYRNRLETDLEQRFDDIEWQAMVDLGYAVDALSSTCLFANFYMMNGDEDEWDRKLVQRQGQMVMDALRWL